MKGNEEGIRGEGFVHGGTRKTRTERERREQNGIRRRRKEEEEENGVRKKERERDRGRDKVEGGECVRRLGVREGNENGWGEGAGGNDDCAAAKEDALACYGDVDDAATRRDLVPDE